MTQVFLRIAELNDSEVLMALMKQLGYEISIESMNNNLSIYTSNPNYQSWIAEIDGKIVGAIAFSLTQYFHREGAFLRVITMIVDHNYRRKGIGFKLMQKAEDFAKKMNCSHVELTSGMHREKIGAHQFYFDLGYVDLSKEKRYFGKVIK